MDVGALDLWRDNTGPLTELKILIRDDGQAAAGGIPDKCNDQMQGSLE